MYTVKWDTYDGQRHERQFDRLEDAKLEAEALAMSDSVEWAEYGPLK